MNQKEQLTDNTKKEVPDGLAGPLSGTSEKNQYKFTSEKDESQGICIHCGHPIRIGSRVWVTCMNCGKMQIWEKDGKSTFDVWKERRA